MTYKKDEVAVHIKDGKDKQHDHSPKKSKKDKKKKDDDDGDDKEEVKCSMKTRFFFVNDA